LADAIATDTVPRDATPMARSVASGGVNHPPDKAIEGYFGEPPTALPETLMGAFLRWKLGQREEFRPLSKLFARPAMFRYARFMGPDWSISRHIRWSIPSL
jgi:hypothetical protein